MTGPRPSYPDTLRSDHNHNQLYRNPFIKHGALGMAAVLAAMGAGFSAPTVKGAYKWVTAKEQVGNSATVSIGPEGAIAAVNQGVGIIHAEVNNDGIASNDFDPASLRGIIEAGQSIEDQTNGPTKPGTEIVVTVVDPRFGSTKVEAELVPSDK